MRSYPAVEDSQDEVTEVMKSGGILHAFAVALALSVHSVFEGLAFGLQDSIDDVCEYLIPATCVFCMYCTFMCAYIHICVCVVFFCMCICNIVHLLYKTESHLSVCLSDRHADISAVSAAIETGLA